MADRRDISPRRGPRRGRAGRHGADAGRETRQRLLDAAERLFATGGLRGTSLRAVTSAAGVNVAAVHYHFGSKEELLRGVFARRLAPINEARLKRLSDLEAGGAGPALGDVVDAFLRPAFEFGATHPELRDLAGLLYAEPAEDLEPLLHEVFGEVTERYTQALARALPHLDRAVIESRFAFCVGALVHVVASRGPGAPPPPVALPELHRFLVGGLSAPSDAPACAPLRGSP